MARTITITRAAQQVQALPGQNQNFTLSYTYDVAASGGVEMPDEVFVLNQRPADPLDPLGTKVSDFSRVATPFDLTALSINAPAPGQTEYRVAQVTRTFDSQHQADEDWSVIKGDVQSLKSALDQADVLNVEEVFVPQ